MKMKSGPSGFTISWFVVASVTAVSLISCLLYEGTGKEQGMRLSPQPLAYVIPTKVIRQPKITDQEIKINDQQTSTVLSRYHVVNRKEAYSIGEKIQVVIEAYDSMGNPQTTGGAYFRAKLVSEDIKAASRSDGEIIDHGNGQYLAEFILRWPGRVKVMVMLVEDGDAVRVLARIREEFPTRGSYIGHFKNGSILESTTCNVNHVAPQERECDFTDVETNITWYCVRPTNPSLTCDHWWKHNSNNTYIFEQQTKYIRAGEEEYFKVYKTYLNCVDCELNVTDPHKDEGKIDRYGRLPWQTSWASLPKCVPENTLKKFDNITSGYLYQQKWYSTHCRNRQFDAKSAAQCLRNKTILLLADSTGMQLYTYLKDLLKMDVIPPVDCMLHARHDSLNVTIYDKFHGLPSRGTHGGPSSCLRQSVVTVLDHMAFTPDVFILSIGAHFSIHTMDLLKGQLVNIRAAVERLHKRSPKTIFIIKSVNTREFQNLSHILSNNEWYLYTLDRLVREIFAGYPHVALVDAWDMTVTQFCKDNVHPLRETLSNIVDLTLSFICPV